MLDVFFFKTCFFPICFLQKSEGLGCSFLILPQDTCLGHKKLGLSAGKTCVVSAGKTSVVSAAKTSVVPADKRSAVCQDIPCVDNEVGMSWQTADLLSADNTCLGCRHNRCLGYRHNRCLACRHMPCLQTSLLSVTPGSFRDGFHLGCQGMDLGRV